MTTGTSLFCGDEAVTWALPFHAREEEMPVGQGTYPSLPSRKSAGMSAVRLVLSWIISM